MFEINLVPDVKAEMIKTLKLRNLIFFICLIAVAAAGAVLLILGGIKGGQDIAMTNQDRTLETMSNKILSYDDLDEILTLQNQLNKITEIGNNKKVLSRVFNILSVLLPNGADRITLSELNINLTDATLSFDAQADAGEDPLIDYRVLEAFKKSLPLMRYDYGRYVDAYGEEIPTRCIKETDENGNLYTNSRGAVYAIWTKDVAGCNPSADMEKELEEVEDEEAEEGEEDKEAEEEAPANDEEENRIWRTPQTALWYEKGYMTLDGGISGVPHFESQCIVYNGIEDGSNVKWTQENSCQLVPEDGITISDSSNGKDSNDNLVLRFSSVIALDPTVFAFQSKHVMAIAPTGRQNVTDSYVQIQGMFEKRAEDCADGDTSCGNIKNETGA